MAKIRLAAPLLSTLLCAWPALVVAEVDKARDGNLEREGEDLEKNARPELEHEREGDHADYHRRQLHEGEKNLEEIRRLLDEIQQNLASKNTGSGTQSMQKDVVNRLDEIIKEISKSCSSCQKGSSSSSSESKGSGEQSRKQQSAQDASAEEQRRQAEARKRQEELEARRLREERQRQKDGEPCPTCGKMQCEKDCPGKVPNTDVADGAPPETRTGSLLNRLRDAARWGLLPPKLREEMLSTGGREPPAEYRAIIERYYKRLSEAYDRNRR